MCMEIRAVIKGLEHEQWEAKTGPDINEPTADGYAIVPTPAGLCLLMTSFKPYSGWLAKNVAPLIYEAPYIQFRHRLMIDDATLAVAQVIETDAKITDCRGWTYDLSAQWNIAQGWIFQVDDENWTWRDTNVVIDPLEPLEPTAISINYRLNYETHRSAITSVAVSGCGEPYLLDPVIWIPARQVGWAPGEIVTQLQQCNNAQPGGYGLRFSEIGYELAGSF
jgi:hypothetical protein